MAKKSARFITRTAIAGVVGYVVARFFRARHLATSKRPHFFQRLIPH
jgi:hypothetical protein